MLVSTVRGASGAAVVIAFEGDGPERCDFVIPFGEGIMFHVEAVAFGRPDEAFLEEVGDGLVVDCGETDFHEDGWRENW